jgi:inorganic pyrophosphatase
LIVSLVGKIRVVNTLRGISMENRTEFWTALDLLVAESTLIIDRPKGSHHPKYAGYIYPVDYGYLKNTSSMDGGGIDVWKGTAGKEIDAIFVTLDMFKKDSEIKILLGCNEHEKALIMQIHNEGPMKGLLITRDNL